MAITLTSLIWWKDHSSLAIISWPVFASDYLPWGSWTRSQINLGSSQFLHLHSCMSLGSILSWFPSSVELHKDLRVSKNITNVGFLRWNLNGSIRKRQSVLEDVWGKKIWAPFGLELGWSFQSLRSLSLTCLPVPGCTVLMVKYHSQVLQCCGQGLSRRLLGSKSTPPLTNWVASCAC